MHSVLSCASYAWKDFVVAALLQSIFLAWTLSTNDRVSDPQDMHRHSRCALYQIRESKVWYHHSQPSLILFVCREGWQFVSSTDTKSETTFTYTWISEHVPLDLQGPELQVFMHLHRASRLFLNNDSPEIVLLSTTNTKAYVIGHPECLEQEKILDRVSRLGTQ